MNAPTATTASAATAAKRAVHDLNAQAISCIGMGDHRGCTYLLEKALSECRSAFQIAPLPPSQSQQQVHPNPPTSHDPKVGRLSVESIVLPPPASTSPSSSRAAASSQFGPNLLTIHRKAFQFMEVLDDHNMMDGTSSPPPPPTADYCCNHYNNIVPAVLIYNMGLSFHLEAVRTGGSRLMMQAHEFYRYSMSLTERVLLGIQVHQVQPPPPPTRPLLAALANNMAHVNSCLYHHANLNVAMRMLQKILDDDDAATAAAAVGDDCGYNDEANLLDEDDSDCFTMNCVFYTKYHHSAQAAAA